MSESEEQQNQNRVRSRRSGVIGDNNSGLFSEQSNLNSCESLPYKTCSEYVQHLNVWILQTQYWNWFTLNYPLIMSQMASIQSPNNGLNYSQFSNNNNNNQEIGQ